MTTDEAAVIAGVDKGNVIRWIRLGLAVGPGRKVKGRVKLRAAKAAPHRSVGYVIVRADLEAYIRDVVALSRANRPSPPGAMAVERFQGGKLGDVSATYAAAQSCPDTCALKKNGCYAEYDQTSIHWGRLNRASAGMTPVMVADAEADAIRGLSGSRPLRLHVAGDCSGMTEADIVSRAALDYSWLGGQPVWTYTHAWRDVPRQYWRKVSVLASCETPDDVRAAWRSRYAAAIVVPQFRTYRAHEIAPGVKMIPCPAMTMPGVTCSKCRLCFDDKRLHAYRLAIGFETHGTGKGKADRRLALPVVA